MFISEFLKKEKGTLERPECLSLFKSHISLKRKIQYVANISQPFVISKPFRVLGNNYLIDRGIDIMPEVNDGVYYGLIDKIRCIIAVMTLKLKKKDATSHRVIVALPHPGDKDDSLYDQIAKMDAIKIVSNLEEVVSLAMKPILVENELNDILEKS